MTASYIGHPSDGSHTYQDAEHQSYDMDNKNTVPDDGMEAEALAAHERNLRRGLTQRHVSMIALAGAIGTGLFLSLGGSIATGGPLGTLLGYFFIGLIVCCVQYALGEVTAFVPVTGSFVRHAELFCDPALGFALGWNIVYGNFLSVPSEITAICVLFGFWTDVTDVAWILVFIFLTAVVGCLPIRYFGEMEFVFAALKIMLVLGVILMGLIIDLGGVKGVDRIGFRYWKNPGPFVEQYATGSLGNFLGFWSVLINAVFSFAGVESIAMAAAETRNPRVAIPKACKRVFARVTMFYILGVLVVGMLVPSNDPNLGDDSGTAATSPFVLAAQNAGIKAVPSIVNAVVITSAFSSSNQALLAGTRVLYGLALKGHAPRLFTKTTSWGTPICCVAIYVCMSFLSFMALSDGAMTVFWWMVDLVGCGVLISWSAVLLNHVRLRYALHIQGIDARRLPWHNSWTPYTSAIGLFFCQLLLLTNGYSVFIKGNWSAAGFVTGYLDIALIFVGFFGWKFIKKTKWVTLADLPLDDILVAIELNPDEAELPSTGYIRYISWLWD